MILIRSIVLISSLDRFRYTQLTVSNNRLDQLNPEIANLTLVDGCVFYDMLDK